MKKTFVLDENILRAASEGSKSAATLLALIVQNCHGIAVSQDLLDSYWRTLHNLASDKPTLLEVPRLLGQLTFNERKCLYVPEEALSKDRVPLHHQKDVFMVAIARAIRSGPVLIVSSDKRTRDDINKRTGLTALTVGEAMPQAKELC